MTIAVDWDVNQSSNKTTRLLAELTSATCHNNKSVHTKPPPGFRIQVSDPWYHELLVFRTFTEVCTNKIWFFSKVFGEFDELC